MGRPATLPPKLMDGFYIEVRNRGSKSGIKIRRENRAFMQDAAKTYRANMDVIILGEMKSGKWIDNPELNKK